jgi:pSer/pThr/pTyr-binding forkhead associated (FHA) protein
MEAIIRTEKNGEELRRPLKVGQRLAIGRGRRAHWQLPDDKISGVHCILEFRFRSIIVIDYNSKNGVYLNGIRIKKAEIFIGDEIRIGDTRLRFADERMDQDVVELLTFRGSQRSRVNYELKPDYTGLRLSRKNQKELEKGLVNHNRPQVEAKLSPYANRPESKTEILSRHPLIAGQARIIDTFLLVLLFALPFLLMNFAMSQGGINLPGLRLDVERLREHRTFLIAFAELLIIMGFSVMNNRVLKYSLGERISGISRLHRQRS